MGVEIKHDGFRFICLRDGDLLRAAPTTQGTN
jgi:hypothetical protein